VAVNQSFPKGILTLLSKDKKHLLRIKMIK